MDTGGANGMIGPLALLSQFNDAINFIFHSRDSVTGGVRIGGSHLLPMLARHVELSAVSLGVACALAIPLGLWLGHLGRGQLVAVSVSNVGRAVPSFALLAFFVAYLGTGFTNASFALILLAIPPILTNTYVGVRQVDREIVDAARGQGMTGWEIVRSAELPIALPLIFGGVRTSAVNVVATATIGPLIGVVTLGDPIINSSVYGSAGQLGASIMVAVLALLTEVIFAALQRAVTPKGLRLAAGASTSRRRFWTPKRRAYSTS
ncbi:MAG: ABC transporter permease [Solirubrobacteraceae bacterium]|nr:MAG: ABC transporter permease [Solirubrobacterales bacterium]